MFQKKKAPTQPKAPVKAQEIEEFAEEEEYETPEEKVPKKKELHTEAPVVEEPQAQEQSEDEVQQIELTEEMVLRYFENIYKVLEDLANRVSNIEHHLRLDF